MDEVRAFSIASGLGGGSSTSIAGSKDSRATLTGEGSAAIVDGPTSSSGASSSKKLRSNLGNL